MRNIRIGVVEDDPASCQRVLDYLNRYQSENDERFTVSVFDDGARIVEKYTPVYDILLLDIEMKEMDGMEALRRMKESAQTREVPVIFLTAKSSEVDKVRGLDLGAEDYITKPFGLLELAARVRAALRRQPVEHRQHWLTGGDLVIDLDNHEVTQSGRHLDLTLKEYELLRILLSNSSRVVPRDELLGEIWGFDFAGETRTLDMHIKTLRAKLHDDVENPRYIKTIRSVGYKFIG